MSRGKRYCCFGTCNSYEKEGAPGYDPTTKFYRFPQPCLLLRNNILTWTNSEESLHVNRCDQCKIVRQWMARCRRSDDRFRRVRQISTNLYICSKHFVENPDKLDYSKCLPISNSNLVNKTTRRCRLTEPSRSTMSGNEETQDISHGRVNRSVADLQREIPFIYIEDEPMAELNVHNDIPPPSTSNYPSSESQVAKKSVGTQTTTHLPAMECLTTVIERLNNEINDLKNRLSETEKAKTDAQKRQATSHLPLVMFEQQLKTNNEMCKFYTNFTIDQLKAVKLFAAVDQIHYWGSTPINETKSLESSSKSQGRTRTYTQAQELLLFFMRMRGGFLLEDIAYRFTLSPSFVSRIVNTWTQLLFKKFDTVRPFMFTPRHLINEHLPARFRKFKNIRVIIDCAEIRCEKSSSFEQQGNCYSEYKAHTTFKFLIGCTPNGCVSFVSQLMEGSISDRAIVIESGLDKLLEEGDLVLADRGFTIRDLTNERGAVLKIPAFLKGRDKLAPQEEFETKEIAANRIFVEHVVGRLKNFRIFQLCL